MWPILILSIIAVALLIDGAISLRQGRCIDKKLSVVSTIITAEPMLGILGTVTGIMNTFNNLNATAGTGSPLSATSGIGEALITTAAGLIASLILIFPYNLLADASEMKNEK